MSHDSKRIILYGGIIVIGIYFLFLGVIKAKAFLVPLIIAILLAMLVVPLANKLESWGMNRGWSSFVSDLVLIGFTVLLFWLIGMQVNKVQEDWPTLQKQLIKTSQRMDKALDNYSWAVGKRVDLEKELRELTDEESQKSRDTTSSTDGFSTKSLNTSEKKQDKGGSGISSGTVSQAWSLLKSVFGFLGSMLLVFIYIFFFLLYRSKFYKAAMHFASDKRKTRTQNILKDSTGIAQQYLVGKVILILFLAVLYSIGLTISGIKYAILISIIAAVLSLIPYLGNVIGATFALIMAVLASGGGLGPIIGVVVTFSITQFVESYILEPFVVGDKVDLNPTMTIVAVVFGEFIWGVPGMILAIPVLGIGKVIFDHIPALQPLGYTVGEEDINHGDSSFDKIKNWAKKKFS